MKTELVLGARVACYDNENKTIDRYTVVYMDQPERAHNTFACVGMSDSPFHPQGFGQHSTAMPGRHLGKRIPFASLPADCMHLVEQDLRPEAGATETWHAASTGNHQGLIISDKDGRNIAVAYDKADAPLIACAPELLAACERLAAWIGCNCFYAAVNHLDELRIVQTVIKQAKGQQ
jgi:hypothetical protein